VYHATKLAMVLFVVVAQVFSMIVYLVNVQIVVLDFQDKFVDAKISIFLLTCAFVAITPQRLTYVDSAQTIPMSLSLRLV